MSTVEFLNFALFLLQLGKRGRSLDSICPVGDPLRISDTIRPFLCGNDPGKPTCPPLYQCLVQPGKSSKFLSFPRTRPTTNLAGNDYGVCCPASLKIQKAGTCPEKHEGECGQLCSHDLECPSVQKCCGSEECGSSCVHPKNVTGKAACAITDVVTRGIPAIERFLGHRDCFGKIY